jgi:hypothetical protein
MVWVFSVDLFLLPACDSRLEIVDWIKVCVRRVEVEDRSSTGLLGSVVYALNIGLRYRQRDISFLPAIENIYLAISL